MRPNDLKLNEFRRPLEEALMRYERLDGNIEFQEFSDLILTPEKSNSARTVIPVTYSNEKVGNMYAIVFLKEDGTGDDKTYKINELIIPPEFQYLEKPERVIPRAKTGVVCEGFFPLFSMNQRGYVSMFASSLEELTVGGNPLTIKHAWKLGQNKSEYLQTIDSGLETAPKIYYTTGIGKNGERFGDPHSIYYGIDSDAIQVVGFLAINSNPPLNLTDRWVLPPGYE